MSTAASESPDVVLIGAGIMSATLGTVLKELDPALEVVLFETLQDCAQESSEAWNNAGTGHAANCELNYTPQRSDGSVDISRAPQVNPALPRPGRDGQGLHAQHGQASAQRPDGRGHRDRRAQRPSPVTQRSPGSVH
jgi:Malate:quinone oxidoreductase (Mqo)